MRDSWQSLSESAGTNLTLSLALPGSSSNLMFLWWFPGVPRSLKKCPETQEHVKEAQPRNCFANCDIYWLPLLVVLWELCSGSEGYVDPYSGTKQTYIATHSQIPCLFNWKLRSSFLKRVHASGGQISSELVMISEWIISSLCIYGREQDNGISTPRHFSLSTSLHRLQTESQKLWVSPAVLLELKYSNTFRLLFHWF